MPMAKQARQICTEKLGLVHPLPFSVVIFREIGHLVTIPIFWSNQCEKVQIIKHEWTPEIYKIMVVFHSKFPIFDIFLDIHKTSPNTDHNIIYMFLKRKNISKPEKPA